MGHMPDGADVDGRLPTDDLRCQGRQGLNVDVDVLQGQMVLELLQLLLSVDELLGSHLLG